MMNVPMSFLPLGAAKKMSRPFRGLSELAQKAFPGFKITLEQAAISITPDEFFSIAIMNCILYFLIFSGIFAFLLYALKIENYLLYGAGIGLFFAVMVLFRVILGVKVLINKRIKSIDSNLIFGLKIMLVEINSGVDLFDAIVMVATHNLGELKNVFKEMSKRLNAGENEEDVLKDIATKNPSVFLRKTLWQIVSGMKAGAPLSKVVQESLTAIERQQKTDVVGYGSSLRVLTLVFMMMGVIIPAMGLSFLAVINSLPGIKFGSTLFWVFLALIIVMQFMIIGLIKSKRPNLMGSV